MGRREPAWRVTTAELAASVEEERGDGERAASYVLSPFGARMNRVLLAGTLGAPEAIGRDEPTSFWRAPLTDAVGRVALTAGSFQPRAMDQLRSALPGRPAIAVGKVHLFRGRDGSAAASVRLEGLRSVAEAEERATLAETLRQTLDRLDLAERLEHEPSTTDELLRASGVPQPWIRGARACRQRYPSVDRAAFRASLRPLLASVAGLARPSAPDRPDERVQVRVDAPAPAPRPATEEEQQETAAFLALVDEAATSSEDGYADVRELLRELAARGLPSGAAEALLGRLEEGGLLEEPIVGKLRRA